MDCLPHHFHRGMAEHESRYYDRYPSSCSEETTSSIPRSFGSRYFTHVGTADTYHAITYHTTRPQIPGGGPRPADDKPLVENGFLMIVTGGGARTHDDGDDDDARSLAIEGQLPFS